MTSQSLAQADAGSKGFHNLATGTWNKGGAQGLTLQENVIFLTQRPHLMTSAWDKLCGCHTCHHLMTNCHFNVIPICHNEQPHIVHCNG
jgi:hypothetical protein